jgi:hypothetical protein
VGQAKPAFVIDNHSQGRLSVVESTLEVSQIVLDDSRTKRSLAELMGQYDV